MQNNPQTVLPASLLVEGKPCLVIGGGNVAKRKVQNLLDALAQVSVIAPVLCAELDELAANGIIEYFKRPFSKDDVNDKYLVFATTDSEEVNKTVVDACRTNKVLCCCVDSGWRNGDFVSPAAFRHDGITISVSTGGRSCTEARDIKNAIREYLQSIDNNSEAAGSHNE